MELRFECDVDGEGTLDIMVVLWLGEPCESITLSSSTWAPAPVGQAPAWSQRQVSPHSASSSSLSHYVSTPGESPRINVVTRLSTYYPRMTQSQSQVGRRDALRQDFVVRCLYRRALSFLFPFSHFSIHFPPSLISFPGVRCDEETFLESRNWYLFFLHLQTVLGLRL